MSMSNVSNFPDGKKSHKTSNKMRAATDKISGSSQKSESKGPDELTVTSGSLAKVGWH